MCSDAFADRTTTIHAHLVFNFKIKDEEKKKKTIIPENIKLVWMSSYIPYMTQSSFKVAFI